MTGRYILVPTLKRGTLRRCFFWGAVNCSHTQVVDKRCVWCGIGG